MTDEDFVDCSLFSNDINDLLSLYKVDAASTALLIKVADLIREVDILSVDTCTLDTLDTLTPVILTQSQYLDLTSDNINAIPVVSPEERVEESELEIAEINAFIGATARSGRARVVPSWMRDTNTVLNF